MGKEYTFNCPKCNTVRLYSYKGCWKAKKTNALCKSCFYKSMIGKKLSDEILKVANSSYKHGEIDFFQYIISLENAMEIKISFLDALHLYNTTILELQYINLQ